MVFWSGKEVAALVSEGRSEREPAEYMLEGKLSEMGVARSDLGANTRIDLGANTIRKLAPD